MSERERLQLENELLMTCSKAQAINKYIDELEESSKLSELWCKSQEKVKNLEYKLNTQRKYYQNRLMKIQRENKQLKENYEAVLKQRDDIVKNSTETIEKYQQKNKQLKDNWNNLNQWLENNWKQSQDIWFVKIINKMKEILKGGNDE